MSENNSGRERRSHYIVDSNVLDEIRGKLPLRETIQEHVKLTRTGSAYRGCCPFHNEKTSSFNVFNDHYHCFGCGAHGDLFTFTMKIRGGSFIDTVKDLADKAAVTLQTATPAQATAAAQTGRIKEILTEAAAFYRKMLSEPEADEARSYMASRGVTAEDIANFQLGWAPAGGPGLVKALRDKGFADTEILAAGLARKTERGAELRDFFFGRVMFPIAGRTGQILSFGGRALGAAQPKYINGTETDVYKKSHAIYGFDRAVTSITKFKKATLVEGNLDVVALHRIGETTTVAPMGTAITLDQIKILWGYAQDVMICMDGDAAGLKSAVKLCEKILPHLSSSRRAFVVVLPPGDDPDSLIKKGPEGIEAMKSALAAPTAISQFLFDAAYANIDPSSIEGRSELRRRVRVITDAVTDRGMSLDWEEAGIQYLTAKLAGDTGRSVMMEFDQRVSEILIGAALVEPKIMTRIEDIFSVMPCAESLKDIRDELVQWWRCSDTRAKESLILHMRTAGLVDIAKDAANAAKAQLAKGGPHADFEKLWINLFTSRIASLECGTSVPETVIPRNISTSPAI